MNDDFISTNQFYINTKHLLVILVTIEIDIEVGVGNFLTVGILKNQAIV